MDESGTICRSRVLRRERHGGGGKWREKKRGKTEVLESEREGKNWLRNLEERGKKNREGRTGGEREWKRKQRRKWKRKENRRVRERERGGGKVKRVKFRKEKRVNNETGRKGKKIETPKKKYRNETRIQENKYGWEKKGKKRAKPKTKGIGRKTEREIIASISLFGGWTEASRKRGPEGRLCKAAIAPNCLSGKIVGVKDELSVEFSRRKARLRNVTRFPEVKVRTRVGETDTHKQTHTHTSTNGGRTHARVYIQIYIQIYMYIYVYMCIYQGWGTCGLLQPLM